MSEHYNLAKKIARDAVIRYLAGETYEMGIEAAARHFDEAVALDSYSLPKPTTEDVARMERLAYSVAWDAIGVLKPEMI